MGLALDEPQTGDRHQQISEIDFVISERDASMVLYEGPVKVRYSDQGWWRGYRVTTARGGGTCS